MTGQQVAIVTITHFPIPTFGPSPPQLGLMGDLGSPGLQCPIRNGASDAPIPAWLRADMYGHQWMPRFSFVHP